MSSPNDQNPNQTPTRNTQSLNWIQMQSEMPLLSPSSQGFFPTPSPPPQGYYPTPSPPPQGYYHPQGHYPPQGYYHPQAPQQTFHPQQTYTALLTQNEGLETINPSLSQPHSTPSEAPSEDTSNKQKAKGKQKAKSREWTIDECETLAKSWIHISEDAIVGRGQQLKDFWNRITRNFNERMGLGPEYRAKDQVYSKYNKMNPEVAFFNDTYLSVSKSNPSGWNETKILQRVNKIYREERGKPFPFPTVWEIVRHNEKWRDDCNKKKRGHSEDEDDEPSQPSKKSRTSDSEFSDAHIGFNLNEFATPSPPEVPQEPRVQARARPAGRDKSKAQARDKGKGKAKEATPALQSKVDQINDKLERLLANEDAKLEQRDMRLLFLNTTHMSGPARAAAEKVKERLRAKYNLED